MKDNESLVVLEPIEYTVTVESAKALANEFSEVPDFDPSNGVKDEVNAQIIKDSKRLNKEISSIEKVRKRIVEPALNFQRTANALAKDLKSIIEPAKIRYAEARSKIDKYEQELEQKRIDEERERVRLIDEAINNLRMIPSNFIGENSEKLTSVYESIEIPDPEQFKERLEEAVEVYKDTLEKLETMIAQAKGAEEVEKIHAAAEAKRKEEEAARDEELRVEREKLRDERAALDKEKAELQAAKDAAAEAERMAKAKAEAEELRLQQEQMEAKRLREEEQTTKQLEAEALSDLEKVIIENVNDDDGMVELSGEVLSAIIEGKIRHVTFGSVI